MNPDYHGHLCIEEWSLEYTLGRVCKSIDI